MGTVENLGKLKILNIQNPVVVVAHCQHSWDAAPSEWRLLRLPTCPLVEIGLGNCRFAVGAEESVEDGMEAVAVPTQAEKCYCCCRFHSCQNMMVDAPTGKIGAAERQTMALTEKFI